MKIQPRLKDKQRKQRLVLPLLLVAFALIQACQQEGCEALQPIPGGFPEEKKLQNAVQIRIDEEGIDFLEQELVSLIEASLGGEMVFDVPPVCEGATKICCEVPNPECTLALEMNGLSLTPKSPDSLNFTLQTELVTQSNAGPYLPVNARILGIDLECDAMIDTTRAGRADVEIGGKLKFAVDPRTNKTRVTLQNVNMAHFDDNDLVLSGGAGCTIANWLKTFFIDTVLDQFSATLDDTVEKQLCVTCTGDLPLEDECGPAADGCKDGYCMAQNRCMQSLGIEGRLDINQALSGVIDNLDGALDIYAVAGNYAQVLGQSISLGLAGGALPAAVSSDSCVPLSDPPQTEPIARSPIFNGADSHLPSHLGVGIHQQFLDRAAWAFWQTGNLCIQLGGETLGGLNSDLLMGIVPSLGNLIKDWPAPVQIKLRPTQAPHFELLNNLVDVNALGERTLIEPLLKIHLPQLEVDIYALVADRFVRLLTLRADVALPLGLDTDNMGHLLPLLGDLEEAITNVEVTRTELLSEENTETEVLFGAALSLLLPSIAANLPTMDLPELLGIQLRPVEGGITSVEEGKMLGLFLELKKSATIASNATIETQFAITNRYIPLFKEQANIANNAPWITLRVDARDAHGHRLTVADFEWQYRIGDGFWSPFHRTQEKRIMDPIFRWQGIHSIQVRARRISLPHSLDPTPAAVNLLVDTRGPWVKIEDGHLTAWDAVTPENDLSVHTLSSDHSGWILQKGGTNGNWTLPQATSVVRVEDRAGHATVVHVTSDTPEKTLNPTGSPIGGCSVSGLPVGGKTSDIDSVYLMWFFSALAGLFVIRRKRPCFQWTFILLGLLVFAFGCSGSGSSPVSPPDDGGTDTESDGGFPIPTENTPGSTGKYNDMSIGSTGIYLAGYEEKFGDLVLGHVGTDNHIEWIFADGLPDEPPTYPTDTYRHGIHSPGNDVGRYASLALTGQDTAIISHHDFTAGTLRFTASTNSENNAFRSHVVDGFDGRIFQRGVDSPFKQRAGIFTSIAVDSQGKPVIAYMATGVPQADGRFTNELRVAQAKTAVPASSTDWLIETIDSHDVSCAGMCAPGSVCVAGSVLDADAGVEELSQCAEVVTTCEGYCPKGMACVHRAEEPGCEPFLEPTAEMGLPSGVGLWPSLVPLPQGELAVSYYDRSTGVLKLARFRMGSWEHFSIDEQDDVGAYSSLAVDASGILHLSYQNVSRGQLLYLSLDENNNVLSREIVDDGVRQDDKSFVGADSCIFSDGETIYIAYQDQTNVDLSLATRVAANTWTITQPSAGNYAKGFFNQIDQDSNGTRWISHYTYDQTQATPGRVQILDIP